MRARKCPDLLTVGCVKSRERVDRAEIGGLLGGKQPRLRNGRRSGGPCRQRMLGRNPGLWASTPLGTVQYALGQQAADNTNTWTKPITKHLCSIVGTKQAHQTLRDTTKHDKPVRIRPSFFLQQTYCIQVKDQVQQTNSIVRS